MIGIHIKNRFILFMLAAILVASLPAGLARAAAVDPVGDDQSLMALFYEDEELFVSSSRSPKPLSQVPEDVTIVSAEEIVSLNAHTLGEVLIRVPGFLARSANYDFGSEVWLYGHGLRGNHVLVLLDGVRFNNNSGGEAFVNGIPLQIIKRIEIIKGPASSVWGSSLGGVVNIITKDTGTADRFNGTASASYGEGASTDVNLDFVGNHFYVYGGRQESDGLENNRSFENNRWYGKFAFGQRHNMGLTLTLGHLDPRYSWGDFLDSNESARNRNTFGSLNLDAGVAKGINLHLAGQYLATKYNWSSEALGQNLFGYGNVAGAPLFERSWDEKTYSGEARLAVERGNHMIVMGGEVSRCEMDHIETYFPALRNFWGASLNTSYVSNVSEVKWGVYVNDTIKLGKLTLVPGIRYDHHSIVGATTSPSLGMTVPLNETTIARLYLGRGFAYPALSHLSGIFWAWGTGVGNPNLKSEKVLVVQGGIETNAVPYLHLAATLFHYSGNDFWQYTWTDPWYYANQYDAERNGFSLEINSAPVYNLSALAGFTYVKKNNQPTVPDPPAVAVLDDDIIKIDLALSYDDNHFARAKLMGTYVYWDEEVSSETSEWGNFLWDFVCGFKVYSTPKATIELFGTVHNLFSAGHYSYDDNKNPQRWVEGGVKLTY